MRRLRDNPGPVVIAIIIFVALQWRHSSSVGSCKPNAGRDLLVASWGF